MGIQTSSGPDKKIVRSDDTVLSEGQIIRQAEAIGLITPGTEEVEGPESGSIKLSAATVIANTCTKGAFSISAGSISETVTGFLPAIDAPPTPFLVSKYLSIKDGTYHIDIGNPLAGGLPSTMSGYKLTAHTGNIEINTAVKGSVILRSAVAPDPVTAGFGVILDAPRVLIGRAPPPNPVLPVGSPYALRPPAPGIVGGHAVLAEQLITFLGLFCALFDAHVHPATSQFSPTLITPTATAAGLLSAYAPTFTSKSVMIGF